jgi:hypothetical protein
MAKYDYANGDRIRQPWAVNLGVRWQWGGKREEPEVERAAANQSTGKQTEAKLVELPPAKTAEPWEITVGGPGWLAGVTGDIGSHGVTSHVSIGVKQVIKNSNVLDAAAAEARKGRFGVLGGYLYINAQDSAPTKGLVSKVEFHFSGCVAWCPDHRRNQLLMFGRPGEATPQTGEM